MGCELQVQTDSAGLGQAGNVSNKFPDKAMLLGGLCFENCCSLSREIACGSRWMEPQTLGSETPNLSSHPPCSWEIRGPGNPYRDTRRRCRRGKVFLLSS